MQADLDNIRKYLETHHLGVNKYRVTVGEGVSQCFGIVSKRSAPPDLSRQSWLHAELHHLLMEYANKHVMIPFTSIQVNCNYICAPHKDHGNIGQSFIIGFGDYTGGELCIDSDKNAYDIRSGLLFNGSEKLHWTKPWTGTRYSLVFSTLKSRFPAIEMKNITDYEAVFVDDKWKIKYNDGGTVKYLYGKNGLPHPLKGRPKKT
jgi:hypothetical protein